MKNVQSHMRYIGTASETKPTTGVNPGSEFFETDTKETYIYTSASWERYDVAPYSYEQSIAEGLRANHAAFFKTGFNSAVGASAEDIWDVGETYTFPTTAAGMEVVSSATSDHATGAGARTVKVYYLNSSFEEKTEIVSLNGTSVVPTASIDFYRINYFKVQTAGSTGAAIGNIDIRHLDNTPIYSRILAGFTRARDLIYTVPKDKTLFLDEGNFGVVHTAANKYAMITVRSTYDRIDSASSSLFYPETSVLMDNGMISLKPPIPLKFPEGTDIRAMASSNGTAAISVGVRGRIESE